MKFPCVQPGLIEKKVGMDLVVLCKPDGKELHVLNATAVQVFRLCDGSHTPENMAEALVDSFDGVDYDQAYEDVKNILELFMAKQFIKPEEE